jgi:hypothetical protein
MSNPISTIRVRRFCVAISALLMVLTAVGPTLAETQAVSLVPTATTIGKTAEFHLVYDVEGVSVLTTGLGLRVHFNSNAVESIAFKNIFDVDMVAFDHTPLADTEDFDKNPATDKFLNVAWMNLDGLWPAGQRLPLDLSTVAIELKAGGDSLILNVSASSAAAGYEFKGTGY